MREYEEEIQVNADTKIYREKNLKSGEVTFLAKGAKVYRKADGGASEFKSGNQ